MDSVDNIEEGNESVWRAIAGRAGFASLPLASLGMPIRDVSEGKEALSDNGAGAGLLGGLGLRVLPLGPVALSPPDGASLTLSTAVAVFVAFRAAAIVLKLRGLDDRRRQPLEDEEGRKLVEEPAGAGDGVRRLEGVNDGFAQLARICWWSAAGVCELESSSNPGVVGVEVGRASSPDAASVDSSVVFKFWPSRLAASRSRRCCSSCSCSDRRIASMSISFCKSP